MTRRVVLAGATLALAAAVFSFRATEKMPDFEVYWRAGLRAAAAEPLYRVEDQHYLLKYLPAFAVFAIPAGLLPLERAKAAWFFISVGLLAALVAGSIRLLPERRKPAWLLAAATTLLMAKFYGHELVLGQVNVLLGAIVVAAIALVRRGREAAGGLLVALAIVVKPYAGIFVPWLIARRTIAGSVSSCLGLIAALLLPAVVYGFAGNLALHLDWWRTVRDSTAPNLLNADNVSLAAMYAKWLGPGAWASGLAAATAAVLLGVAGLVFARRRGLPFPEGLEAALLLTLIPLLSPQGWDYVFLVSTPATVFLVNYGDRLPRAWRAAAGTALAVIAFSLFDLMGRQAYAAFMAMSIVSVCYLVVIAALGALRWHRIA